MADCIDFDQLLEPDPPQSFAVVNNNASPSFFERGVTAILQGQTSVDVAFQAAKVNADYTFNQLDVENTIDGSPLSLEATVVGKSTSGFSVLLSGIPDSSSYRLNWEVEVSDV